MTDLIGRLVARLLSALLFPVDRGDRAVRVVCPQPRPRPRALPEHMSPLAREVAQMQKRPIVDTTAPVRPYVLNAPRRPVCDARQRAQAERRWALDMALRGLDVGPHLIHGVHVQSGSRTIRLAVGA